MHGCQTSRRHKIYILMKTPVFFFCFFLGGGGEGLCDNLYDLNHEQMFDYSYIYVDHQII